MFHELVVNPATIGVRKISHAPTVDANRITANDTAPPTAINTSTGTYEVTVWVSRPRRIRATTATSPTEPTSIPACTRVKDRSSST